MEVTKWYHFYESKVGADNEEFGERAVSRRKRDRRPTPGYRLPIESARTAPSISRSHLFVLLFNHDQTHDIYTSCRFSTLDARSDDEELDSKAPLDQNVIKFDPR